MNIQAPQKKPRPGDGAAAPDQPARGLAVNTKGAPEEVLVRAATIRHGSDELR
jgi:hypothetical protein